MNASRSQEWLEADGLGGFASGTATGVRTRRYHALLLTARTPPTGRVVLVNGFDAWVETSAGRFAISSQAYAPDVTHPDGEARISDFRFEPWPSWTFALPDGTRVAQEVFVAKGSSAVAVSWRLLSGSSAVALEVRPFFSGRDYHALHHENPAFRFDATESDGLQRFWPYDDVPAVAVKSNGVYSDGPEWYRNFLYAEERARGLDAVEDLASPGTYRFNLMDEEAVWLAAAEGHEAALGAVDATGALAALRSRERGRRGRFVDRLDRAADSYLVRRGKGRTIVAGYPWFTDWGRDTFIALRGLCLSAGRLEEAGEILGEWAGAVSEGMLPNFFPDAGARPEFNSVDASLWYIVAVYDYLEAMAASGRTATRAGVRRLESAIDAILTGYSRGTRFRIGAAADGLLAAGEKGVQLTWMDAKVGDWVVTPRIGKPVEVQALWLNALWIGGAFSEKWRELHDRALASFHARFWNAAEGCLYDVVDPDHVDGTADATFRPNQIFAVGGLPFPILEGERARRVVDAVEAKLSTRLGLRSLEPGHPAYRGRYEGGPLERDGSYHQGTVWPFLSGAFVDAWVRVRGGTAATIREARTRFLEPLLAHLDEAGLGHVSEIADADTPHTPRGCPFQAWSVGETLRIDRDILALASKTRNQIPEISSNERSP